MARKKTGKPRGKPQWPKGPKLAYLESMKAEYDNDTGKMYRKAAKYFVDTWGTTLKLEEEPIPGFNHADPDINTFPKGPERNAENQRRAKFETDARTRIGNWSRHHWTAKKTDRDVVNQVLRTMLQLMNARPRKVPILQRYQQEFWDTRLKISFEDHWAKANLPLNERNRYASLMFDKESEAFVKDLTEKNDKEYAAAMAAYRSKGTWNSNAATYFMAWKKVHRVGPTLADVLAQLLGVGCTIVLYGPRSDGNIDVTSIDGMVPESVSKAESADDFDPKRMGEMKDFFRDYAADIFTEAVCQSRVYDEEVEDEEAEDNEAGENEAGENEAEEESGPSTATNPSPVSPNLASPTPVVATLPTPTTTTPVNNADAPAMPPAAATAASKDGGSEEEKDSRAPREAPNLPTTPSPPSNNTPVSSAVANGQAGPQFAYSNPTMTTPTSVGGFIFPEIDSGVTTNGTNGGGLCLWDELHGDLQAGCGGMAEGRASGGPNFEYNLAQSLNGTQNFDPQPPFSQHQSFAFQQNQFPHQQPFYPQSTSLLDQLSLPQQAQSSFNHHQCFAYPQQTLAQPAIHQEQASLPVDHTLASTTCAHNVPAGHSSSLPSVPPPSSVPPSSSPLPLSSDVPASSATIPIIPPAPPTTDQVPEKENDPNVQPKKGRKRKSPEQVPAGGEPLTERSKRPRVLTEKMALTKQDEDKKAKKKQGGPKASTTANVGGGPARRKKSTTKK
ncbi:hypothetical protein WG66_013060 [Moniliophthora roreri]|nr:hypothetical protein WG66_013060 [Moniliophthora roreri]